VKLQECLDLFLSSEEGCSYLYVDKFLDLFESLEEIYELVTPDVIRSLRQRQPGKLLLLLAHCSKQIYSAYELSISTPIQESSKIRVLQNSVRIITRIAPFMNEEAEEDSFSKLLWSSMEVPRSIEDANPDSVGFSILGAMFRSGFIRGFSIPLDCRAPQSAVDPNRLDTNIVWGRVGGIGGVSCPRPGYQTVSKQMADIRVEIVRMGITLLTGPLFQSMAEYKNSVPVFNRLVVSGDFIHTANFFVSLLCSVLDYDPSHYGIPIVSTVLESDDTSSEERLASSALTLINMLLDPPSSPEEINVFKEILAGGFSEREEICTLVRMLKSKVLGLFVANSALGVQHTYRIRNKNGFILFIFNLLTLCTNPLLMDEIRSQWGSELVLAMLALIASNLSDPAQVGLVHTSSFILLRLSGDREFILDIFKRDYRREIDHHLGGQLLKPAELAHARIADIVFLTLLRCQSSSESLAEMWLTILCNISPLVGGNLTAPAASALLTQLEKTCRPGWLLKKPLRHHSVAFLIETVNNILSYQYDSSSNLVYQLLLRGPRILENLESMADQVHVYNEEWKAVGLLDPMKKLVEYLGPRIGEECEQREGEIGDQDVKLMIRKISLVGILPVPRPIVVRHFHMNEQTRLWFTSYLFGIVFVSLNPMPILDWRKIRMIHLSGIDLDLEDGE
jgi:hypothetical protein